MKKVIVYDFDKTLTENDTLFSFFIFNERKSFFFVAKLIIYISYMICTKLKIISNDKLKELGIKLFLSNLTKEELTYKFSNFKSVINFNFLFYKTDFSKYQEDIYIVSASFKEYLEPIFPKNVRILASSIRYENGKAKGLLFNCYAKNKIKILEKENIKKIDIFYTDSISDLPLVEVSKKTFLIKNDKKIECLNTNDFLREIKK